MPLLGFFQNNKSKEKPESHYQIQQKAQIHKQKIQQLQKLSLHNKAIIQCLNSIKKSLSQIFLLSPNLIISSFTEKLLLFFQNQSQSFTLIQSSLQNKIYLYHPSIIKLRKQYDQQSQLVQHYQQKLNEMDEQDIGTERHTRNVRKMQSTQKEHAQLYHILRNNYEAFQQQAKQFLTNTSQNIMCNFAQSLIKTYNCLSQKVNQNKPKDKLIKRNDSLHQTSFISQISQYYQDQLSEYLSDEQTKHEDINGQKLRSIKSLRNSKKSISNKQVDNDTSLVMDQFEQIINIDSDDQLDQIQNLPEPTISIRKRPSLSQSFKFNKKSRNQSKIYKNTAKLYCQRLFVEDLKKIFNLHQQIIPQNNHVHDLQSEFEKIPQTQQNTRLKKYFVGLQNIYSQSQNKQIKNKVISNQKRNQLNKVGSLSKIKNHDKPKAIKFDEIFPQIDQLPKKQIFQINKKKNLITNNNNDKKNPKQAKQKINKNVKLSEQYKIQQKKVNQQDKQWIIEHLFAVPGSSLTKIQPFQQNFKTLKSNYDKNQKKFYLNQEKPHSSTDISADFKFFQRQISNLAHLNKKKP